MYIYNLGLRFEKTAHTFAAKHALQFPSGKCLTYCELNERSNQFARFFLSRGVVKNDVICIVGYKTPGTFSSLLACLKIGAIYTVIDPAAISYLVDAAKRYNNKAIVTGKVYYFDQPEVLQHTGVIFKDQRYLTTIYPGKNEKDIGQCDEETERDSLDDVFWLLPAEVVKRVGYYSDYFFLYAAFSVLLLFWRLGRGGIFPVASAHILQLEYNNREL